MFGILAVSSLAFVSCSSKNNEPPTLNGDWELIENPEISDDSSGEKVFYTFSEPGKYGDGTYKTIYDGGIETGDYKLSEKDGKEYINMGTGELEYTMSDSELTVIYPANSEEQDDEKYIFKRETAPDYENESYDSFEIDEDLISEWITEERTLPYYTGELSMTFVNGGDGTYTITYNTANTLSITDSVIQLISSFGGKESTDTFKKTDNSDVVSLTKELSAGKYTFKISNSGTNETFGKDSTTITDIANRIVLSKSGSDIILNATGGTYEFKFELSTNRLSVYTSDKTADCIGDVNADGKFNITDAVLLQKWLLAVPNISLPDWKAADLCEDGVINVSDLCMMKHMLINQK